MRKLHGGFLGASVLFTVAVGCATGNSDPVGSSSLAAGSGISPDISTTIYPEYGLTVFGGAGDCQSFACTGANSCSSQPWYSASSQRYGCGVHLQVTAKGKCVVVETQDAGPASWVESDAGIAILDAGPAVAQYLFGTNSIGWSDIKAHPGTYTVEVSTTSAPLGPCGATDDAGSGDSGSGGSGGKGGAAGSGGSGGDGGAAGDASYAFIEPRGSDRHHARELTAGASETIPFTWRDAAGLAPPADLWVEAEGRTVLQVSSLGGHPFVRAGLDVVALDSATSYRLVLTQNGDSLSASVVRDTDQVVFRTEARAGDRHAGGSVVADVVLPGTRWGTSIESAGL